MFIRYNNTGDFAMKTIITFTRENIEKLPENKPTIYIIITRNLNYNYIGLAPRGRIQERLFEHLPSGPDAIPGAKIIVEQVDNIVAARSKMEQLIRRKLPKYNKQSI